MSIRTTVTLDDDVAARLKELSLAKGVPFRSLLNEVVRTGLLSMKAAPSSRPYRIKAVDMGAFLGNNLDNIGEVISQVEGDAWR